MKTVLITGASRGIGSATAELFAKNGYNVCINYNKSDEKAKQLQTKLLQTNPNVKLFKADISSEAEVGEMFSEIKKAFGGVDVLVNNAAVSTIKPIQNISLSEWRKTFAVNVDGMFICTKEALSFMIEKKSGSIVNISSIWGITGASCEVHYSASKAAVIGFTKALAKELAPSGIRVNCVSPGATDTDMNKELSEDDISSFCEEIPLGRFANPNEIAESIFFLASNAASYITGQVISPNGGSVI